MVPDRDPHTRLTLSGDFDSPAAVLASDLDPFAKLQILDTWLGELEAATDRDADTLRRSVEEARATLHTDKAS